MPYRRLPKTDAARLRALKTLLVGGLVRMGAKVLKE